MRVYKKHQNETTSALLTKARETLSGIAAQYGTIYQALAVTNCLAAPNLIYPRRQFIY